MPPTKNLAKTFAIVRYMVKRSFARNTTCIESSVVKARRLVEENLHSARSLLSTEILLFAKNLPFEQRPLFERRLLVAHNLPVVQVLTVHLL